MKSDLWSAPLPASRHAFGPSGIDERSDEQTTYGDYFTAARQFLAQDKCALLCQAASQRVGKPVASSDIERVSIYLVKHGAFYHPACVVVYVFGHRLTFVLNVAVAAQGQEIITQEYRSMSQLNAELGSDFWPQVFGSGQGEDTKGRQLPMFLGQWLDGFHEFHLTGEVPEQRQVVVWDADQGHRILTQSQTQACLQQAAAILSYAYNPISTEAIGNWHHGAGDFVAAVTTERIRLCLITVRNYSPTFENAQPDVAFILEAALVYLMQVSLKLRLDRLDGIGSVVCHGVEAVPAICRGFFMGLHQAASVRGLPDDFDVTVKEFISLHDTGRLLSIAADLLEKGSFNTEERDLLSPKLQSHASALGAAFAA